MANKPKKDAQVDLSLRRCPKCGASDVSLDAAQGKLKCNFCRHVFDAKKDNALGGVQSLNGEKVDQGAEDIIPSEEIIVTLKCPSCGAEVVVNASEDLQVSCHWCRHILTIHNKIMNGAVPDLVLPFKLTKDEAKKKIAEYVAGFSNVNADFKEAFDVDKVQGVYFPYLIVDVRAVYTATGDGEKTASNKMTPPFKVDTYDVFREFDLFVDDLTVESSSNRLNQDTFVNSNNVINAILPFDTENAVAWDANFLRGYASEKRDVNLRAVKEIVALQCGDIGRRKAHEATVEYDRGVHWNRDHLGIKGTKWRSAYLPVWIYSYKRPAETNDKRIYYIALNARTGEIVGDIPLGVPEKNKSKTPIQKVGKAFLISAAISFGLFVLGLVTGAYVLSILVIVYAVGGGFPWLLAFVVAALSRENSINRPNTTLRTSSGLERHYHEDETHCEIGEIKRKDKFVVSRNGEWSREIRGRNDTRAIGSLSNGRDMMNNSERMRFANGSNYSQAASAFGANRFGGYSRPSAASRVVRKGAGNAIGTFFVIMFFIVMVLLGLSSGSGGGSYSGGSSSYDSDSSWSYDSDWGSSWDSGSSYDSDSSWDSGSSDDSGFDYSYDY